MSDKFFIGESGECYDILQLLGQGGQGSVYEVRSRGDGTHHAVKWYHRRTAVEPQRERLKAVTQMPQPAEDIEGIDFVWPAEMVTLADSSSFGYVMPLFDPTQFVPYVTVLKKQIRQPSPDQLCKLGFLICCAIDAVHRSGFAYCDINLGNILFDLEDGCIVICDNDSVVVNNSGAAVYGVLDFMAPEVALRHSEPNALSDSYSIAILLYQMWMWEHPMEGSLTASIKSFDDIAKLNRFAKNPLFAHHPTDQRNTVDSVPLFAHSQKRWERCPDSIKELFIQSFTVGVDSPGQRPRLSAWQAVMLECECNTADCTRCGARNHLDAQAADRNVCFQCGTPFPVQLVLEARYPGGVSRVCATNDTQLMPFHIGGPLERGSNVKPLGRIEKHPKVSGAHILRNLSPSAWTYQHEGAQLTVEPESARALIPTVQLTIDGVSVEVVELSSSKSSPSRAINNDASSDSDQH